MTTWCIVALPEEEDAVWQLSSEKVPHMTLLFLGEQNDTDKAIHIAAQLQHTANTSLNSFNAGVHSRGVLGDESADVLFFDQASIPKELVNFRSMLLKDNTIRACYDSALQYPSWTPHLTMGYPHRPARKPPSSFIYETPKNVYFNRVALWIEDSDGPTFTLDLWDHSNGLDSMAMSGLFTTERQGSPYSINHARKEGSSNMSSRTPAVTPSNLKHHGIGARKFDHKNPITDALPETIRRTVKSSSEIELETENIRHTYSGLQHQQMLDPENKYVRMNQLSFIENLQHVMGGRPSERAGRKFDISSRPDGDWLLSSIDTLAHSGTVEKLIRPFRNDAGLIVDYQVMNTTLGSADVGIALKHFGVKGMKWGVRRNNTGGDAEPSARQQKKQAKAELRKQKRQDGWKKPVDADARVASRQRTKKHGTDQLSDEDLDKLVKRMSMEVRYASLVEDKRGIKARSSGQQYAKDLLKDAGKQLASEAVKFAFDEAVKKGQARNSSGSTYTPSTRVGYGQLSPGRRALNR